MNDTNEKIREEVREIYAEIAIGNTSGCAPGCCGGEDGINMIGDAYDKVAGHVAEADLGLGCGLPVEHAGIQAGDTVLDLGSGAGNDVFIARHETGASGHVVGVDMTPEMITKARANCENLGYKNVEFRQGQMESLPIESNTIDVVISNCVLNLVPDKRLAFGEIHRVLKPGARYCISDIVSSEPLPDWTLRVAALYAGCVSGAIPKEDYLGLLAETGFGNINVVKAQRIDIPEDILSQYANVDQLADAVARDLHVISITVTGVKSR